jgi:hypothetical protein
VPGKANPNDSVLLSQGSIQLIVTSGPGTSEFALQQALLLYGMTSLVKPRAPRPTTGWSVRLVNNRS